MINFIQDDVKEVLGECETFEDILSKKEALKENGIHFYYDYFTQLYMIGNRGIIRRIDNNQIVASNIDVQYMVCKYPVTEKSFILNEFNNSKTLHNNEHNYVSKLHNGMLLRLYFNNGWNIASNRCMNAFNRLCRYRNPYTFGKCFKEILSMKKIYLNLSKLNKKFTYFIVMEHKYLKNALPSKNNNLIHVLTINNKTQKPVKAKIPILFYNPDRNDKLSFLFSSSFMKINNGKEGIVEKINNILKNNNNPGLSLYSGRGLKYTFIESEEYMKRKKILSSLGSDHSYNGRLYANYLIINGDQIIDEEELQKYFYKDFIELKEFKNIFYNIFIGHIKVHFNRFYISPEHFHVEPLLYKSKMLPTLKFYMEEKYGELKEISEDDVIEFVDKIVKDDLKYKKLKVSHAFNALCAPGD